LWGEKDLSARIATIGRGLIIMAERLGRARKERVYGEDPLILRICH